MSKVLRGSSLAGTSSSWKRSKYDFYATPKASIEALLSVEHFKGSVLEPCCGNGAISKALKQHGLDVTSNDIVNRGYGDCFKDFLTSSFHTYDNVITNPPFSEAKSFIEKSISLARDKVAMFCKIQLLEGVSRYKLFKQYPPKCIHVFVKRQNPLRGGLLYNPRTGKKWASTMCFAWFVWVKGYKGKPTVDWLLT